MSYAGAVTDVHGDCIRLLAMASELIRKAKVPTLAGADAATISAACDQCGDSLAGLRVVRKNYSWRRRVAATAHY